MITRLLDFCLRERLVVLLAAVAVAAYGWHAIQTVPLDAIPDVGENQVIVLSEWPGRSPKDMEDQITYPLSVALQAVPGAKSVRGKSMFGFSFVQVTFGDEIDFYWARSRVAEQLTTVTGSLPQGVTPQLAPDATALGQIFFYVLEPPAGVDLAELRSRQDFFVRYALESVEGVAEVASIGGYVRQYQVDVDPDRLRFHQLTLSAVVEAVRAANIDVGAKTVESGGMEFLVRGRGFIGSGRSTAETIGQIETTVIATRDGIPVRLRDVASVQLGPAFRRGGLDHNGAEAVGGVVIMRYGANPRDVIERVQAKISSLEPELDGIRIVGVYDRTGLIDETIHTLTEALSQETMITIVVVAAGKPADRDHPAPGGADGLRCDEALWCRRQHHVAGGHRHCHRHDGRHGDHRAGKHLRRARRMGTEPAGARGQAASRSEARGDPQGRRGGGARGDDRGDHNSGQFPAGVFPHGPRREALHTTGLDKNLRAGGQPDRRGHGRAGAGQTRAAVVAAISARQPACRQRRCGGDGCARWAGVAGAAHRSHRGSRSAGDGRARGDRWPERLVAQP
jgi:hypothetical protein